MSRIDELIAELCPDGVELRPLGEVGLFIRGNGLQKSDLLEAGVGAIHYGQIHTYYGTWATETKSFVSEALASKLRKALPGDLVVATTSEDDEAVAKAVAWIGDDAIAVSGDAYIYRHTLDPRYVAYFFQTEQFQDQKKRFITGTKVRRVSGESLAKVRIPVPPIEIQREIVKILDTFTALEAELEAELEARRRQYAYYRDRLLEFPADTVPRLTLALVCKSISAGGDVPRRCCKGQTQPSDRFPFPIYSNGTDDSALYGFTDTYQIEDEAVTISARGAKTGFHAIRAGKFTPVIRLITLVPKLDLVSPKFLNLVLGVTEIGSSKGSIPQLTIPNVQKIPIAVPPLEEQERIVATLDAFHALVNDLSIGLPAELNARRKQYEYYRDKLLTFEERGA